MMPALIKMMRSIFAFIDQAIYGLIDIIYSGFTAIAQTSIFSSEMIQTFLGRIYAVLGIFMLFKVAISLINYIINPDDFTDKAKGMSKFITNIVTTLIFLVITPWAFQQAMEVQKIVLDSDVIGSLIFGINSEELDMEEVKKNAGKTMAFTSLTAFFHVDTELFPECADLFSGETISGNAECSAAIGSDAHNQIEQAIDERSISTLMTNLPTMTANVNGEERFIMSYTVLVSMICGGFIFLIILSFCFDIAIRSVKLGFLQLIAPIPIIMRIDPKSGKDGMFGKWLKTVGKTYGDLFIRIAAVDLAVLVISLVVSGNIQGYDAATGSVQENPIIVMLFVKVFIILGVLLFAKQLPKLIEEITGIKLSGSFQLNPMKRLSAVPVVGGAAAAGLSLGGNSLKALGAGVGKLITSGGDVSQAKAAATKRMNAGMIEARERFSASGFMGTDKYSGQTAGKIIKKEKAETRDKERKGKLGLVEKQAQWKIGDKSMQDQKYLELKLKALDNATSTAEKERLLNDAIASYKKAGFKNEEFIRSKIALQVSEDKMKRQDIKLREANNTYQSLVNNISLARTQVEKDKAQAAANTYRDDILTKAQKDFDTSQKSFNAIETTHKENIAPKYSQDNDLDIARKVAKGPMPGRFDIDNL